MKFHLLLVFAVLSIAGCASNAPTFAWYHPLGGEYLFTYDKGECEVSVADQGLMLGVDTQGPFFRCMHQRGYYLVDADGVVRRPDLPVGVVSASVE